MFADFRKILKKQYRSMIRLLFLERKSCTEIKQRLDAVNRCPETATTKSNVINVHDFLLADRRLKLRELVKEVVLLKYWSYESYRRDVCLSLRIARKKTNCRNSELHLSNLLRGRQKLSCRHERGWLFFWDLQRVIYND